MCRHGGRSLRSPPCQKSRTDTNRKSKQWTTPKPTQNNHPHSSRYHDFKYQIPLIWYFQPIRDHVSFSWCCLDWLSTPPFIESYCYLTVLELSTGAQQNFFFLAIKDLNWIRKSYLCPLQLLSPPSTQRYLWRLNSVTVNEIHLHEFQQQHTQGLLKCAVYGLKYYGWATREKLYHSYPTTDTSLVLSHYETEPSVASRI